MPKALNLTVLPFVFSGPDLLGHEKLKEYVAEFSDKLEPLLSAGVVNSLMEK